LESTTRSELERMYSELMRKVGEQGKEILDLHDTTISNTNNIEHVVQISQHYEDDVKALGQRMKDDSKEVQLAHAEFIEKMVKWQREMDIPFQSFNHELLDLQKRVDALVEWINAAQQRSGRVSGVQP